MESKLTIEARLAQAEADLQVAKAVIEKMLDGFKVTAAGVLKLNARIEELEASHVVIRDIFGEWDRVFKFLAKSMDIPLRKMPEKPKLVVNNRKENTK